MFTPSSRTNRHRRRIRHEILATTRTGNGCLRCDDACSAGHRGFFGVRQLKLAARRRMDHQLTPACYTTRGGTNNLAIDLNGSWSRADQYRRVRPAGGRLRCEHPRHRLLLLGSRRRYAELRHCAHPGWLEQRDRAGQSGPATRPAKLHAGCGRLRGVGSIVWPSGEFVVQHHAVG